MPVLAATTLAVLALLVGGAADATAAPTGAGSGQVSGRVTEYDPGAPAPARPLAGAVVTAKRADGRVLVTTRVRADGSYLLRAVPAGPRTVCVDGSALVSPSRPMGYLAQCWLGGTPVTVTAGGVRDGVDVALPPAALAVGRVSDLGGNPLAGVRVSNGPSTVTGPDGTWQARVAAGFVRAWFDGADVTSPESSVGFLPAEWTDPATRDPYVQVGPGATVRMDQTLQAAAAVGGVVTDALGHPLSGVLVTFGDQPRIAPDGVVEGPSARTDAEGRYRFDGVYPDTSDRFLLADARGVSGGASRTGYTSTCQPDVPVVRYPSNSDVITCWADDSTPLTTVAAGRVTTLNAVLRAGGAVTGKVTDRAGHLLAGGVVTLLPGDGGRSRAPRPAPVTVRADGTYRVPGVGPGPWRVCVGDSGGTDPALDPFGYTGTCSTAVVTATRGAASAAPDVVLRGRGAVDLTVVDEARAAVPAAAVVLTPLGQDPKTIDRTDDAGHLRYIQPAGDYVLTVYGTTDTVASRVLHIEDTTQAVTLVVRPGGRINGTVSAPDGGPGTTSDRVWTTDLASGAVFWWASSGTDGSFRTSLLPPGRYAVCVEAFGQTQCWKATSSVARATPVRVSPGVDVAGIALVASSG